jgi:hypothetical protein
MRTFKLNLKFSPNLSKKSILKNIQYNSLRNHQNNGEISSKK